MAISLSGRFVDLQPDSVLAHQVSCRQRKSSELRVLLFYYLKWHTNVMIADDYNNKQDIRSTFRKEKGIRGKGFLALRTYKKIQNCAHVFSDTEGVKS